MGLNLATGYLPQVLLNFTALLSMESWVKLVLKSLLNKALPQLCELFILARTLTNRPDEELTKGLLATAAEFGMHIACNFGLAFTFAHLKRAIEVNGGQSDLFWRLVLA